MGLARGNTRVRIIDKYKGATPGYLVGRAIKEVSSGELESTSSDEVWCIFDRDNHTDIGTAFTEYKKYNTKAERDNLKKIRIAYSNESFEYWCLLHFDYIDTALERGILNEKLGEKINTPHYGSNGKGDKELFEKICNNSGNIAVACRNAMRVYSSHGYTDASELEYTGDTLNWNHQPNTTVHFLVNSILKIK